MTYKLIKNTRKSTTLSGSSSDDMILGWGVELNLDNSVTEDSTKAFADRLYGKSGNDYIHGGAGSDALYGDSGDDYLNGGTGNDYLYGGSGNDYILGEEGNDKLNGESGDDYLNGGTGNDILNGGIGNDELYGDEGSDTLNGESGDDYLNGGAGNDILNGGIGNDELYGGEGSDTLNGESGNDYLNGGAGNDTLKGEAGDDILFGGAGLDILTGGKGKDVFMYTDYTESTGYEIDIITDFELEDKIDLSSFTDLRWSMNETMHGVWFKSTGIIKGEVHADTDGDGVADLIIKVNGPKGSKLSSISASNFLITPTAVNVNEKTNGIVVADFTDPNSGGSGTTFSVDDERFEIVAGQLKLKDDISLDYDENTFLSVTATAYNAGKVSMVQTFAITVNDVAETRIIMGTEFPDQFNHQNSLADNFIISGLAGDDSITTGSGNDIVRPGEGADTVNTGAGSDIIVLVGQTAAGQYTQSDITNPGGSGIDLSSIITLADLNDRSVSEVVAGESIDGGTGTNRLIIYGNVDLTGVTLTNITQFQVNSTVTISAQQLIGLPLTVLFGDNESVLNITNSSADPVTLDFSRIRLLDFKTLNIGAGITVIVDQADVETLQYIAGNGTIKASTASNTLDLTGKWISVNVQTKNGAEDSDHGATVVDGDILIGSEANDNLIGTGLADRLEGGAGNDILVGGNGNDILRGGAGVDSMDGGDGDDIFVIVGDLSGGGKIDSAADTRALGQPLTNLNGVDLNEDENGAAEIIIGGEGDDTLYVYGTADLSLYSITGIEHIVIRSHVTFNAELLASVKSLTGDGSSTVTILGGTAADPLIVDLTSVDAITLSNIGHLSLGENVVLKINSLDQLGGARLLTGNGTIEATGNLSLPSTYTVTSSLKVTNIDISSADTLTSEINSSTPYNSATDSGAQKLGNGFDLRGTTGDDYIQGTAYDDVLDGKDGNDILSGKDGDDIFKINGTGTKIILDSAGDDTLDLSNAAFGATMNLTDGGTVGDSITTVRLGSGSEATSKLPLDLFIVEDLSSSFSDDVNTVKSLLDSLISQIKTVQPDSAFGAGSFVDKPTSPFGGNGDYVYQTWSAINSDANIVKKSFNSMDILDGNDTPEAQLEALYQVALRTTKDDTTAGTNEIGFRPGAMRVVIIATDAPYHEAGDNPVAVNNGDTILDGTPAGTGEDYPSVSQVKEALIKANIFPIFTVTSGNESTYQDLANQLGRGNVVNLSSDSSNLINAITTGLANYKVDFIEDLIGTEYNDTLTGNSLDNRIEGGKGDDILTGLGGNDTLVGGAGDHDVAVFTGNRDQYTITTSGPDLIVQDKVSGRDGTDTLISIETIRFSDQEMLAQENFGTTAEDLFVREGYYKLFFELSTASYNHINELSYVPGMTEPTTDRLIIKNHNKLINAGVEFLDASSLDLSLGGLYDGFYVAFADGYYVGFDTNGLTTSVALVGVCDNALFLTFRGTDTNIDWWDDLADMQGHYDRYAPLISAIDTYLAEHSNIEKVYVSGHSLGGQMAMMYMNAHQGPMYEAITFEAANKFPPATGDVRFTNFEMRGDPVPDIGLNQNYGKTIHLDYEESPLITSHTLKIINKQFDKVTALLGRGAVGMNERIYVDDNADGVIITNSAPPAGLFIGGVIPVLGLVADAVWYEDASEYQKTAYNFKTSFDSSSPDGVLIIKPVIGLNGGTYNITEQFVKTVVLGNDKISPSENVNVNASAADHAVLIVGNDGNNILIGGEGNDVLIGNGDKDVLLGGDGNDFLYGGKFSTIRLEEDFPTSILPSTDAGRKALNDFAINPSIDDVSYLIGGAGKDTMWGSGDNDYFFIDVNLSNNTNYVDSIKNFNSTRAVGEFSNDYLIFSGEQLGIDISEIDATFSIDLNVLGKSAAHLSSFNFQFENSITDTLDYGAYADQATFILSNNDTGLYFDKDGQGADFAPTLLAYIEMGSGFFNDLSYVNADQILLMGSFNNLQFNDLYFV